MKLTPEQIDSLLARAPDYQDDWTLRYYAPHFLEELDRTTLFSSEYAEIDEDGALIPSIIGPAATWDLRIPRFLAEYCIRQCRGNRITVAEVMLAGKLLTYYQIQNIADQDLQIQLLDILSKQTAITNFASDRKAMVSILAQIPDLYTKIILQLELTAAELSSELLHGAKRRRRTTDAGDETNHRLIAELKLTQSSLSKTKFALERVIVRYNNEFGFFMNMINVAIKIPEASEIKKFLRFMLAYPFIKYLNIAMQGFMLQIYTHLVSCLREPDIQLEFLGMAVELLKSSRHIKVKENLLEAMTKMLTADLKAKFTELLVADIKEHTELYSPKVKRVLFDYGFAFRDCDHLDAQCKAFLRYLHADSLHTTPLVTAETMNLIWHSADPSIRSIDQQFLRLLIGINFAKPELELTKDDIADLKLLVIRLSAITQANIRESKLIPEAVRDIRARARYIATFVKAAADANTSWFTGSKPVRFKIQGVRCVRGDRTKLYESGGLFISVRYSNGNYEIYNPHRLDGGMQFADTEQGILTLAGYLLNEVNRSKEPETGDSSLAVVRFTQYSQYSKAPQLIARRAATPTQLHSDSYTEEGSPIVRARSLDALNKVTSLLVPTPMDLETAVATGEPVTLMRHRSMSICDDQKQAEESHSPVIHGFALLYPDKPRRVPSF